MKFDCILYNFACLNLCIPFSHLGIFFFGGRGGRLNFGWKFNDRKNALELNVRVEFLKAKGAVKYLGATGMSVL